MIESKLQAVLKGLVNGRVFPSVLPLDYALPAMVYTTIAVDPNNTVCGAAEDEEVRIQIDVYARTLAELLALRPMVFAAMEAAFESAVRVNDFDGYEPDTKLYRRIFEFSISY